MIDSDAVAVTFAAKVHPVLAYVVTAGVCLSLIGSINITFLAAGRMPFVAGRMGFMPEVIFTLAPDLSDQTKLRFCFRLIASFGTEQNYTLDRSTSEKYLLTSKTFVVYIFSASPEWLQLQ